MLILIVFITGCSEDFLTPKPLSFYSPENTLNNPEALLNVLATCEQVIRTEFIDRNSPISWEMCLSDICVEGTTDKGGKPQDLNNYLLPDQALGQIDWYWDESFRAIKNANTVISRIDLSKFDSEEQKNAILGTAYFHRAYWYYKLCNQFGDVPLILEEITSPRVDFKSSPREDILKKIKEDLEFAQEWVTDDVNRGGVTNGAVSQLLTKVNLALCLFDDAIASANNVINGGVYRLMTARFGIDASNPSKNLTWDLHRPENKSVITNKEALLLMINRADLLGRYTTVNGNLTMRNSVANFYVSINTPNGNKGTIDKTGVEFDLCSKYGRGTGVTRNTAYYQHWVWDDPTDERHLPGNWVTMEDLVYNNPSIKGKDIYYGKHLQLHSDAGVLLCIDTIRCWYDWPHYKVYVVDYMNSPMMGGYTDWYVFRLAETYLLRAEAYFWKGDLIQAANDINKIRVRANALPFAPKDINIGSILDERARELYYEEPRKSEITRIAFILAKTGKVAYNNKSYNIENFSEDNFYYDRVMEKNDFYNKGAVTVFGSTYTMSPYHVLWPIPARVINANVEGVITQNKGY